MLLLLDGEAVKPDKNEKHDSYFCSSVSRFLLLSFLIISDTIWSRTRNLQNKELKEIAAALPEVVLAGGASAAAENMVNERLISKPVSYTHLRAHETEADLVCRLLLEKKNILITFAYFG